MVFMIAMGNSADHAYLEKSRSLRGCWRRRNEADGFSLARV
jgi:hypothetical protein